ncbi:3-dehydroquinate synthase [Bacillus massilinigeriensis]|uniref:3-dehydroquinate synthase n=1 Tax=Bacillus mediterraneensis TaxID=1805474 RepID=UPI0008F824BB|nr:3-dehydroquinate synthase [Bacillus mediterraneensis]
MKRIKINTASKGYWVTLGENASREMIPFIVSFPNLTSIMVITDETVGMLYLNVLKEQLKEYRYYVKTVPSSEHAKTFEVYYDCLTSALEHKLDRNSLIIAFGGGAVGDLAGFVAATFMRGIPFIQVPTTILAHDSAVGGKVAVNHPLGKNMIGAFHQPEAVFYDTNYLSSLPIAERRSGFAEIIKHALISDRALLQWLLENINDLSSMKQTDLEFVLQRGISIKSEIVSQDEKETGVRAFLNFGHTLGHAIEGECGYGNMTHGEAVLIGMLFALKLSEEIVGLKFSFASYINWLQTLGYQTHLPEGISTQRLMKRMKQDKKSVGGKITFILLKDIGSPVKKEIPDSLLFSLLNKFLEKGGCE